MKIAFYFILKALFVFKIFRFSLDFLVMHKKGIDYKYKFNFKTYDVTAWLTNNYNTHIVQCLTK